MRGRQQQTCPFASGAATLCVVEPLSTPLLDTLHMTIWLFHPFCRGWHHPSPPRPISLHPPPSISTRHPFATHPPLLRSIEARPPLHRAQRHGVEPFWGEPFRPPPPPSRLNPTRLLEGAEELEDARLVRGEPELLERRGRPGARREGPSRFGDSGISGQGSRGPTPGGGIHLKSPEGTSPPLRDQIT